MRRATATVLHCMLVVCLMCSCISSRESVLAGSAPAGSFAVLTINWNVVSKDQTLRKIAKGDQFDVVLRQLNLTSDAISEIAVFAASSTPDGSNGMLLRGPFNRRNVTDHLRSHEWLESSLRQRRTFCHLNECVALLQSNTLVYGTRAGVEDVIKAEENRSASFAATANFKTLLSNLGEKQRPISMLLALPPEAQEMADAAVKISSGVLSLTSIGPLNALLEKIGAVRGAGCSIARSGKTFPVELVVMLKDEGTAGLISGSLNLMKKFSHVASENISPSDAAAYRSFQTMSVKRMHEVVSIELTMSEQELMKGPLGK